MQTDRPAAFPEDVNRRILIVDDNQAIHSDFRKILAAPAATEIAVDELAAMLFEDSQVATRCDFELDSAYQGREALDRVTSANAAGRPYAVAFVDMRMPPGWDGLETIEHIWRADPLLQVVICSAYSDHSWQDLRERLGERDALLIIKKPFDPIEVVQSAHALTAKWALAQRARARVEDLEAAVRARTAELEAVAQRLAEEMGRRDRMAADLRLANRLEAVGQLAAGVAHEMNTPIQYVSDSLAFVREGALDLMKMATAMRAAADSGGACAGVPADLGGQLESIAESADLGYLEAHLPDALDRIQDGVARVATIVRAMKELAHPGEREMTRTDLNRAIRNALQVTASSYRYAADLVTDLVENLPLVTCLAAEMNQVLLNLIVNAAHAMEGCGRDGRPRGRLGIATRADGPDVVISISDSGHGIPEAIRERIFDAFFTTKEVGRGTGQGLAISRAIVDRHGGRLTFESTLGVGTTFHIRLPVAGSGADAAPV